jgi:urease accessory protein
MKKKFSTKLTGPIAFGITLIPALAQAHPGHSSGLAAGVAHPLSGVDHLAVMLGVGLWAAQLGGRARFLVPLAFCIFMALGALLGITGFAVADLEQGLAASVLIVGLLLAAACRLPLSAAMAVAGGFAVFHGAAHGSELPAAANGVAYVLGFLVTSAVLLGCGMGLGSVAAQPSRSVWLRFGGAGILTAGLLVSTIRL